MRLPKLLMILFFEESRKVCFGLWLFIVATTLLFFKLIDSNAWMLCAGLSTGLVGGGTLGDKFLDMKKGASAAPAGPAQPQ